MPDVTSPTSLRITRITAWIVAILGVVQAVLGILMAAHVRGLHPTHEISGYVTLLACVAAAIACFVWQRRSGNRGLFFHALGMAVIAVIQIALGSLELRTIHMTVGVAFLVGAIALAVLATRKPGAVRA